MKFTKAVLVLLMMTVMTGSGQAATNAVTLTINVTFTQPGCDITVPPSHMLDALVPGKTGTEHPPLKITWSCEGNTPLKTALAAAIVLGDSEGDRKVHLMTDGRKRTGVTLSLREKTSGNLIKLTGTDNFCSDMEGTTGMRTCTLTPVTDVSRGSVLGNASATLRFEVRYV